MVCKHTVSVRSEVFCAGRSSNGRTAAFEAVNLGSIPSLPAQHISLTHLSVGQLPLKP